MIPSIKMPLGFRAAGINSGARRYRPDFALVISDQPCTAVGTFTKNTLKASPVRYNMARLPAENIRAVVCNSGHANVGTGVKGDEDNLVLAQKTAHSMGIDESEMLVASTGVVGERIPLDTLISALPSLERSLGDTINNFSLAIMTTDLVPKFRTQTVSLAKGEITFTGASKGSGMIHPNMGTMLGFIFCDAWVDKDWAQELLREIIDDTFNMISVDGETSTNDMVLLLNNGASNLRIESAEEKLAYAKALRETCQDLAIAIAKDGEGASKLITTHVRKSSSMDLAKRAARDLTTSPLIKAAIHGEDPNWGRILVRLGYSGVSESCFEKLRVQIQEVTVYENAAPVEDAREKLKAKLKTDEITLEIDLNEGDYSATAWGCDLTRRYVDINTEYS